MAGSNNIYNEQASTALIALVDKKIRKYHKKLRGVDAHKESQAKGLQLSAEQAAMLTNEGVFKEILDELAQLKAGFVAEKLEFTVPEPEVQEPEVKVEIKKKKVTKGDHAQRAAIFGYLVSSGYITTDLENTNTESLFTDAGLSAQERQLLVAYVEWLLKQKNSNADKMAFFEKQMEKVAAMSGEAISGFESGGPVHYNDVWKIAEKLAKEAAKAEDFQGFLAPKMSASSVPQKKETEASKPLASKPGKKGPASSGKPTPKSMLPVAPPSPAKGPGSSRAKATPRMAPPVADLGDENLVLPKAKPVGGKGSSSKAPGAPTTKPPVDNAGHVVPSGLCLPPPTVSTTPAIIEEPKSKKPEPDDDGFMTVTKRGGKKDEKPWGVSRQAEPEKKIANVANSKSVWSSAYVNSEW